LFCSFVRSCGNKMLVFFCSFSTTAGGSGCDYSEERWVWDPGHGAAVLRHSVPRHGQRELHWQRAVGRRLPRLAFLAAVRGKHVAFVGHPMVCIRAQSLVCLLGASSSFPYTDPALGVPVAQRDSVLVPGAVPRAGRRRQLQRALQLGAAAHLDALAKRWSTDADTMDVAVINTGHCLL
jgi:xyloglucan O-acetyltransferase